MDLEVLKDKKKFYIRAIPDHHKEKSQEIEIHLKQAQSMLLNFD